jgi:hypothetical protein
MESKVISRKKSKGKKGFTPKMRMVEFEPEDFFWWEEMAKLTAFNNRAARMKGFIEGKLATDTYERDGYETR